METFLSVEQYPIQLESRLEFYGGEDPLADTRHTEDEPEGM